MYAAGKYLVRKIIWSLKPVLHLLRFKAKFQSGRCMLLHCRAASGGRHMQEVCVCVGVDWWVCGLVWGGGEYTQPHIHIYMCV